MGPKDLNEVLEKPRCDAWSNSNGLLCRCSDDLGHSVDHSFDILGFLNVDRITWAEKDTIAHADCDLVTVTKMLYANRD
jgi:hypothetical protein